MTPARQLWIVDDDLSFCDFLRQTLTNQTDYQIAGMSHTLHDAKHNLAQHQPDLVTVDLSLPDGSGVELVRWLQQHYPSC